MEHKIKVYAGNRSLGEQNKTLTILGFSLLSPKKRNLFNNPRLMFMARAGLKVVSMEKIEK